MIFSKIWTLSSLVEKLKSTKAFLAAATASSTSSEFPAVITPRTESSEGFITSIVSVE